MPLEFVISQKQVVIKNDTNHLLELYKETANKLQIPNLNTDQVVKNKDLWSQLMLRTVEKFFSEIKAGARSMILNKITLHFDRPSEIIFEQYQVLLTQALIAQHEVDLIKTEEHMDGSTGDMIIDSKYVLAYELLIRMVALALDVSILGETAANEYLKCLEFFWNQMCIRKLLVVTTVMGVKKNSQFFDYLVKCGHGEWIKHIKTRVKVSQDIYKHKHVIFDLINKLKSIQLAVERQLVLFLAPDSAVSRSFLSNTIGMLEFTVFKKDASSITITKRGQDLTFYPSREELEDYVKDKDIQAHVEGLYQLLRDTKELQEQIFQIDMLINYTGWLPILAGFFDFSKLAKLLESYALKCRILKIEKKPVYEKLTDRAKVLLGEYQEVPEPSDLILNSAVSIITLNDKKLIQRITDSMCNTVYTLVASQRNLKPQYQFIDIENLKKYFPNISSITQPSSQAISIQQPPTTNRLPQLMPANSLTTSSTDEVFQVSLPQDPKLSIASSHSQDDSDDLKVRTDSHKDQIDQLSKENFSLKEELRKLTANPAQADHVVKSLNQIEKLKSDLERKESTFNQLRDENTSLKSQIFVLRPINFNDILTKALEKYKKIYPNGRGFKVSLKTAEYFIDKKTFSISLNNLEKQTAIFIDYILHNSGSKKDEFSLRVTALNLVCQENGISSLMIVGNRSQTIEIIRALRDLLLFQTGLKVYEHNDLNSFLSHLAQKIIECSLRYKEATKVMVISFIKEIKKLLEKKESSQQVQVLGSLTNNFNHHKSTKDERSIKQKILQESEDLTIYELVAYYKVEWKPKTLLDIQDNWETNIDNVGSPSNSISIKTLSQPIINDGRTIFKSLFLGADIRLGEVYEINACLIDSLLQQVRFTGDRKAECKRIKQWLLDDINVIQHIGEYLPAGLAIPILAQHFRVHAPTRIAREFKVIVYCLSGNTIDIQEVGTGRALLHLWHTDNHDHFDPIFNMPLNWFETLRQQHQ